MKSVQEIDEALQSYREAKKQRDEIDKEINTYRDAFLDYMKASNSNKIEGTYYTLKAFKAELKSVDSKKLEEQYPQVYKDCLKVTNTTKLKIS